MDRVVLLVLLLLLLLVLFFPLLPLLLLLLYCYTATATTASTSTRATTSTPTTIAPTTDTTSSAIFFLVISRATTLYSWRFSCYIFFFFLHDLFGLHFVSLLVSRLGLCCIFLLCTCADDISSNRCWLQKWIFWLSDYNTN